MFLCHYSATSVEGNLLEISYYVSLYIICMGRYLKETKDNIHLFNFILAFLIDFKVLSINLKLWWVFFFFEQVVMKVVKTLDQDCCLDMQCSPVL